jgi:flagellar biosynthesis GTPase FlhF
MEAGIRPLLAGVLQADTPRKGGPTTHYPSSKPGSGRRTAGYALLGAGAALVAGGVFFGLQASSKADEFRKTDQTDVRTAEKLRSDGQTFALIADIGVIAGLVSAGTGTWLAFAGEGGGGKDKAGSGRPAASPPPDGETASGAGDKPGTGGKPSAKTRAEEERRAREEARRAEEERRAREEAAKREEQERRTLEEFQRIKREEDERLKREEEEEKRKREEQERRAREEQARLKREEEEQRKREEEERKKRPPLDEDDLRNY